MDDTSWDKINRWIGSCSNFAIVSKYHYVTNGFDEFDLVVKDAEPEYKNIIDIFNDKLKSYGPEDEVPKEMSFICKNKHYRAVFGKQCTIELVKEEI